MKKIGKLILTKIRITDEKIVSNYSDEKAQEAMCSKKSIIDERKTYTTEEYYLDGNIIRCYLIDDEGIVYACGEAKCAPEDEFIYEIGIELSQVRATMNGYKFIINYFVNNL